MGQRTHLPAMMRIVRNHVGQHGCTRGPGSRPTVAAEDSDPALRPRQSVGEHFEAARGTFNQSGPGLLLCAASAVERGRDLEMGADNVCHLQRMLLTCATMAAIVRPLLPGSLARHAAGSRYSRTI
jgi:hypothetical protein